MKMEEMIEKHEKAKRDYNAIEEMVAGPSGKNLSPDLQV